MNNIVRPINDPFWDSYYPPNGWRCRCDVMQTDDDVTDDYEAPSTDEVPDEFLNNPGKTGEVFTESHPFFNAVSAEVAGSVKRQMRGFHRKEIKSKAREEIVGKTMQVGEIQFELSMTDLKRVLYKDHSDVFLKNELTLLLPELISDFKFLDSMEDQKDRKHNLEWRYYILRIWDLDFILNIRKHKTGEFKLHAITDNIEEYK